MLWASFCQGGLQVATAEEIRNTEVGLAHQAEAYASLDIDKAVRRDLQEQLNFDSLRGDFETIKHGSQLLVQYLRQDTPLLPPALLNNVNAAYGQADVIVKQIRSFDLLELAKSQTDPVARRNALLSDADNRLPQIQVALPQLLSYLATLEAGSLQDRVTRAIEERVGSGDEAVAQAEASAEKARDTEIRLQQLFETAQARLAQVTVAEHATAFKNEADKHRRVAYGWLVATALVAAGTLGVLLYNLIVTQRQDATQYMSAAHVTQLVFAKVVVYSLLGSATVWCGRMYRAHRHNEVVNRHRQNALTSFEAFVAASKDEQSKSAVLIQATNSIFMPQHTGYSTSDAEPNAMPAVIDLIRAAGAQK